MITWNFSPFRPSFFPRTLLMSENPVQPAHYGPMEGWGRERLRRAARPQATYGAPNSVAASVLCRGMLKKPHRLRSQPCLAAGRPEHAGLGPDAGHLLRLVARPSAEVLIIDGSPGNILV